MQSWSRLLICSIACWLPLSGGQAGEKAAKPLSGGLVDLATVAPTVRQDIRYATADNFTGTRLPGYERAACLLRRDVALALARVQKDLSRQDPALGLKVFDCYRPRRAVRAMERWSTRAPVRRIARFYFPSIRKSELFSRGYISRNSSHSYGTTVDLTLVRLSGSAQGLPTQVSNDTAASCRAHGRDPRDSSALDMGTAFDCFDVRSHTRSDRIDALQAKNRRMLVRAMAKRGFRNYHREWWHFSYSSARKGRPLDVPIR